MSTPPPHSVLIRLHEALGSHQAILACFDIAVQPDREVELFSAFERMSAKIGRENDVASAGVHSALLRLVFVAIGALKVPKGGVALDPVGTGHARLIGEIVAGLPAQAGDVVTLARESPMIGDFLGMYRSEKAQPVSSPMLMRAAVAAVRAIVERHGDDGPDSQWFVLGQLFGSLCLSTT